MFAFFWLLIPAVLILISSLVLSFFFTRRYHLIETHSPAEFGLPFENVAFSSGDGLILRGWWIPAPGSDHAVIQLHGHSGSMDPDIVYAAAWHAAGYNVLMFDFRAHGRSPGKICTFGYLERQDVIGAVRFLKQEKTISHLALFGLSLGGMVAILSAPLCPQVEAVIEDGAPMRIRSALAAWSMERHLPSWISHVLAWITVFGASLRLRVNLFQFEPARWISKIKCPLLIIHGDQDQYCPDFPETLEAACPAEIWRLPRVGHVQASQAYPEEYRERVIGFLDKNLGIF